MSRRLVSAGGDFRGVISASVDLAYFQEIYRSIKLQPGSAIALFRRDGVLLVSEPDWRETIDNVFGDVAIFRSPRSETGRAASGHVAAAADGTPHIGAYSEIGGFPLVMSVAMDESAALADWKRQALLISLGAAAMVLLFSAGIVVLATAVRRDATLTHALRDSEARLNGVIESAMDAVVTVDEGQRIVLFNPAAKRMFRCAASEALGQPLERFIPARHEGAHQKHMEQFARADITSRAMGVQLGLFALRADGEEFPIDASISRVEANGDLLFTAILRDVTERRQAAIALEQSHRQVRALAAALQASREEEQRRIGRQLHEELAQQLTGLLMELAGIARSTAGR